MPIESDLDSQTASSSGANLPSLARVYRRIREMSEQIAAPLSAEDCSIESMPDVSPTKWHLAHTTWFFEVFLLQQRADFLPFDARYESLFNSYYNSLGIAFPRDKRGLISRPGLDDVLRYRRHVDHQVLDWLAAGELSDQQCIGRIQRKIHVQSVRFARRILCYVVGPYSRDVSQFFSA